MFKRIVVVTIFVALSISIPVLGDCTWVPTATSLSTTCASVGVGTLSPAFRLHVNNDNGAAEILITGTAIPGTGLRINGDRPWKIGASVANSGPQKFAIADFGVTPAVARLVIDPAGNVGIGNPNPAYRLDVAGDANFSGTVTGGNIQAKYQDVAEWVPATGTLLPGTLVVLDRDHSNHVLPSSHSYDTSVAGVVSERPGLILGEAGDSKAMVATTGRVKVKVDATVLPIAVGDLLVTSSKAGMAMRSEPMEINGRKFHQPGTLIGKALEPLDSGTGEILVLLSLQ